MLGRQIGVSPQKLDNLLRDWTGNFGREALRAADGLARATGIDAQPARGAPVLSSFMTQDGYSSDMEHTIRRRFERAERVRTTARELAKRGDEDELRRYVRENAEQLIAYDALKTQSDMLRTVSDLRQG